jgi:hypothetical protein
VFHPRSPPSTLAQVVDADDARLPLMDNVQNMLDMKVDERVGAVMLGWDARFDYR